MVAEFRDLERKHLMVKEQYESEIMRLKGQAPASAPGPLLQPQHAAAAAAAAALPNPPAPAPSKRRVSGPDPGAIATYSPTMPPDQHSLPAMFNSRSTPHHGQQPPALPPPLGPHPSTHHQPSPHQPPSQPITISSPQAHLQLPVANHVSASSQPMQSGSTNPISQSHLIGQQPNSTASSMRLDFPPIAVGASISHNIPSLNSAPSGPNIPRQAGSGLMGKMPSLSLMPPNGLPTNRDNNNFNTVKKEVGMPMPGGMGPSFGASQRVGLMSAGNSAPPMSQPNHSDDWAVYQGRSNNGATVNMQVKLQNSLTLDSVVCCVRYSWDGRFLATGSNRAAHIFDSDSGRLVATFGKDGSDHDAGGQDSYVRAVCFSPDGNWLITGAEDHVVKVWDVRLRKVKHVLVGHGTDIYSVDASANSQFIISGSGDKKAKLWSLETGGLLRTLGADNGPTDGITSVSVSPTNQHVAAGSLDKIVRVWDAETGRLVRQFESHRDSVYSVAFSPDGRLVLSGSLDKTLKLWDLAVPPTSNQCRLTFPGHKDFVLSVAFSPNGKWLISGSKDRTVQFWDPRQPTMYLMLRGHKNSVISIAHSPTAKALATGSGDCCARTWVYSPS